MLYAWPSYSGGASVVSDGHTCCMGLLAIVLFVTGIFVSYWVVHAAVLAALNDHYKTRTHFEATGEWKPGHWSGKTVPRRSS